ncbi:MAG TPA: FGGY family carbohydrate kinase, partial [Aggregatilineales bacterium]|nr:FGGY family carbohydrate kinase [Aggregatilineales bacterium]
MYLGIDLGTQSVKVILVDESGRVIRTAKEKYPIHRPQPDHVEQNPDEWWGATINAVQSATRHYTDQIKGIGVAGQMHGVVLLDKAHQPLRPAIIWMDQRSSVEVQQRTAAEWLEMAYNPLTPGMTLASLLWLKKHEPATCDAIATILLPKDWIRYKLTGSLCTELSDASGGFLLDLPRQTWSLELLALCELIPAQLPHLMRSTDVAGELISPAADVLGLPKLIPVCAGAADQAAMLVGSGVLNPGDAALTIGTGGQMSIVTDVPR